MLEIILNFMDFSVIQNFLHTLLSPYGIDEKWYFLILIGIALLFVLVVYIVFMYIRAFFSWIAWNSEIIAEQKYQTSLLEEMLVTQKEQLDILQALFVENSDSQDDIDMGQAQNTKKYHNQSWRYYYKNKKHYHHKNNQKEHNQEVVTENK